MVGKNDDSIKKEREKIIKWYDETSESYPQWNLYGLYFLPQIKQGKNKEKSYDLIHARWRRAYCAYLVSIKLLI